MDFKYVWAFDPGSVATGVACIHPDSDDFVLAEQFPDPKDAWHFFETQSSVDDIVLIEMYRSAGFLNQHAQKTIEVIGFLKHTYEYYYGKPALIVAEQARLSGRREASKFMGADMEDLWTDPHRKDAFSALAHCCAYRRRISG